MRVFLLIAISLIILAVDYFDFYEEIFFVLEYYLKYYLEDYLESFSLPTIAAIVTLVIAYFRVETYAETKIENEFKKGEEKYDDGKYAEAIQIWMPLAQQGYPRESGKIVKGWKSLFRKGYPLAQCKIGAMYEDGAGVVKDYKEAFHWYKKGARQNHALSQAYLGYLYRHGLGVKKDENEALRLYKKSAKQENVSGQNNLAFMYRQGLGGAEQNYDKAFYWYKKAADQGHAGAQCNIGFMYSKGRSVKKDSKEAIKWFRQSALQGDEVGQYNLGRMYEEKNSSKSNVYVYKWFYIADKNRDKEAQKKLKAVKRKMKSAEIKKAEGFAEWSIENLKVIKESGHIDINEPDDA